MALIITEEVTWMLRSKVIKDQSMAASVSSDVVKISKLDGWAVQFVWTGSPTSTVKVQASVDGVTFADVPGAAVSTGGSAGSFEFNVGYRIGYNFLKLVSTFVSGTGTLNAWVSGKERAA